MTVRACARKSAVVAVALLVASLALGAGASARTGAATSVRVTSWLVWIPGREQPVRPGSVFHYCTATRAHVLQAFFRMRGPRHVSVKEVWRLNGKVKATWVDKDLSEVGPAPAHGPVIYGSEDSAGPVLANGVWSVTFVRAGRVIGTGSVTLAAKKCAPDRGYGYTQRKVKNKRGRCFGCVTLTSWTVRAYPAPGQDVGNCADIAPVTVPGPGRVIGPNVSGSARRWWIRWTFTTACPYDFSTLVRIYQGSPPIAIRQVNWQLADGSQITTGGATPQCVNFSGSTITATVTLGVPDGNVFTGPLVIDQYLGAPDGSCR